MNEATADDNLMVESGWVAEWSNAPVLKTGDPQGSVGSNPTPSAFPMNKGSFLLFAICLAATIFSCPLRGGTVPSDTKASPTADDMLAAFQRGALDLQIMLGAEESFQDTGPTRPNIDCGLTVIRFGYMLDAVRGSGFFRGNDEVLIEAVGGPIYTGPGTALGGLSLVYRRNFVPPSARFVPYIDLGVGGVYSDAYHQPTQHALGSPFEFDLQGGVGLRYRLDAKWSVDGEVTYRHLSNAGLAPRNYGTNALGGLIGFSCAF